MNDLASRYRKQVLRSSDLIYPMATISLRLNIYVSDLLTRVALPTIKLCQPTWVGRSTHSPKWHISMTPHFTVNWWEVLCIFLSLALALPTLFIKLASVSTPWSPHFAVVLQILWYIKRNYISWSLLSTTFDMLKGITFHGVYYPVNCSLELCFYSDAYWEGDPKLLLLSHDSLNFGGSKKETLVSRSSTETKYLALADTTQELIWLHWLWYGC